MTVIAITLVGHIALLNALATKMKEARGLLLQKPVVEKGFGSISVLASGNDTGAYSQADSHRAARTETRSVEQSLYPLPMTGLNRLHYLETEELDTRSAPTIDWRVARHLIPTGATLVAIVTVWVSSEGYIDYLTIENPQSLQPWGIEALSELQQTQMEPATLNGQSMPSTMTIELMVSNSEK